MTLLAWKMETKNASKSQLLPLMSPTTRQHRVPPSDKRSARILPASALPCQAPCSRRWKTQKEHSWGPPSWGLFPAAQHWSTTLLACKLRTLIQPPWRHITYETPLPEKSQGRESVLERNPWFQNKTKNYTLRRLKSGDNEYHGPQ